MFKETTVKNIACALLLGASAFSVSGQAGAADMPLIIDPVAGMPGSANIYVQLLGGFTAALDTTYFEGGAITDYNTEAGFAVAATLGIVVMEGLSVEGDVMYSKRGYAEPFGDDTTASLSVMGNVKYTAQIGDQFAIYGAIGLGHISISEFAVYPYYYSGLGYQLILGAAMDLTESASLVAEVRYQNTFSPAEWEVDGNDTIDAPNLSLLAGVKFGF